MMADLIALLLTALTFLLIARAVLSWIPIAPDSPFRPVASMVYGVTEPILAPIRGLLPSMGGFDISPILVILLLQVLRNALT